MKTLANGLGEYWWSKDVGEDRVYENVCDAVKWLDSNQKDRQNRILDAVRMYGNYDALGLSGLEYARQRSTQSLRLNVVKAVVDTLTAYIATQRTRPMFLTSKGNYDQQQRAKKLNRFAAGQLYGTRFYQKVGPRTFRDAALFGKGWAYVYRKDNEVAAERAFPGNILIDDVEAREGSPRQLFYAKEVAREVLYERFVQGRSSPSRARIEKAIMGAELLRYRDSGYRSQLSDPVTVVEAFHIPSAKDAHDGRRTLCISTGTLEDDEWSRGFPFATMDWTEPLLGYWGHGVVQEIDGVQCEINYILQKIQRSMTLASSQMWVQKGSRVNTGAMTNEDWAINEYEGTMPALLAVQSISPEYFTHLDRLWNKAFELAGVSALAAAAKKPGGLQSGEALREYKDAQSQRFVDIEDRYDALHINAVELMIESAKEIDEDGEGGYQILAKSQNSAEVIKWSDVRLDDDKYILQAFPTNFLPQTPAGRIESAKELTQAFPQLQPYALSLFDFPDLEAAVSAANSDFDYCDRLLTAMLEEGKYESPDPVSNLQLNVKRMTQAYLRAKLDGVDEERLQLVLDYISEAQQLLQPPAPPPQPGGLPPPAAPGPAMPPGDVAPPMPGPVPPAI